MTIEYVQCTVVLVFHTFIWLAGRGRRLVFLRIRDELVEFGVLSVVAKDKWSAMTKYVTDFEQSTSDVIGSGMVPDSLSSPAVKCGELAPLSLSASCLRDATSWRLF